MLRKIFAVAVLCLASLGAAHAQSTAPVILPGGCGTGSAPQSLAYLTVDSTLKLCVDTTGGAATGITPTAPSGSLTLATGGTSQQLMAAAEAKNGCTIQNPATATEPIWVDFTGAAAVAASGHTSLEVVVGQTIPCGAGITTSINWIAATTSHTIVAVKF